jgi:TPR repeat protein
MSEAQLPWHTARQQLARALQNLQSENKSYIVGYNQENRAPQQNENVVQQLHARIAAVRSALLAAPAPDDVSVCADGSAATPRLTGAEMTWMELSVDKDASAAGRSSKHAAASAAVQRTFDAAVTCHEELDFAAALPLFTLAADARHAASCGYLALYYIEGRGCSRDPALAWTWACRGAEMNDACSMGLKARWLHLHHIRIRARDGPLTELI